MKRYFVGNEKTVNTFSMGRFWVDFYIEQSGKIVIGGTIWGDTRDECYATACAIILWLNEISGRVNVPEERR